MTEYSKNKINDIPELEIKGEEKPRFEWSGWWKLIFKKTINFTWRF